VKRYCITDSLEVAARAAADGVEMIQIRAKELSGRALAELVRGVVALERNAAMSLGAADTSVCATSNKSCSVIVNTRFDIALACGADGVHSPGGSVSPAAIRRVVPPGFLIGVSCHVIDELRAAEAEGADFAVYGPVFPSTSKTVVPIGLDALRQATEAVGLPVYALGGVTRENAPLCIQAGAAGVAGISLFT
jgi:thiamine-phosphate pyrophosphorylase